MDIHIPQVDVYNANVDVYAAQVGSDDLIHQTPSWKNFVRKMLSRLHKPVNI